MNIVVDENIPFGAQAFGTLGKVECVAGRKLSREAVRNAELLIVRSVTKVNEALLDGSKVRFVGTCTIGTDHIDLEYLQRRNIAFASAPGSNANSVGEYITAALLVLARRRGMRLEGRTLGVVGVGNVGRQVVKKAETLGMRVLQNDPPLQRQTGEARFRPIEELLDADFLTFHVPLSTSGPDATHHLINEAFLSRLKRGSILLNSSRGPVADGKAVLAALDEGRLADAVLDVWEGEPEIDIRLLGKTAIGTPHIAGYSYDGKVLGTVMIYRAACKFLGLAPHWDPSPLLPPPDYPSLRIEASSREEEDALRQAVLTVYDIERDDADLRKLMDLPASQRGAHFDALRKNYPQRREFYNTTVTLDGRAPKLAQKLSALGFRLASGR